jgi:exonuclease III
MTTREHDEVIARAAENVRRRDGDVGAEAEARVAVDAALAEPVDVDTLKKYAQRRFHPSCWEIFREIPCHCAYCDARRWLTDHGIYDTFTREQIEANEAEFKAGLRTDFALTDDQLAYAWVLAERLSEAAQSDERIRAVIQNCARENSGKQ